MSEGTKDIIYRIVLGIVVAASIAYAVIKLKGIM